LQRDFELDIVNIHDPGQEHWKKKYVWWIPALHIDGKEVAKGRWDAQTVIDALDSWQTSRRIQEGTKEQL
jgi:zinc finger CCHC domain-containing protein 8